MRNKNQGFTLIDTLIALSLTGLVVLILGTLYPGLRLSETSQTMILVDSILQTKMEELKSLPFDSLLETSEPFTDASFDALTNASGNYTISTFDVDNDGTTDDDVKLIFISLAWDDAGNNKSESISALSYRHGSGL